MLAKLRNLGPASESMLAKAGITTETQLRALGAVAAFRQVRRSGANPSLNLLWALEGALTNQAWQDVAKERRLSLLLQLEQSDGPNAMGQ